MCAGLGAAGRPRAPGGAVAGCRLLLAAKAHAEGVAVDVGEVAVAVNDDGAANKGEATQVQAAQLHVLHVEAAAKSADAGEIHRVHGVVGEQKVAANRVEHGDGHTLHVAAAKIQRAAHAGEVRGGKVGEQVGVGEEMAADGGDVAGVEVGDGVVEEEHAAPNACQEVGLHSGEAPAGTNNVPTNGLDGPGAEGGRGGDVDRTGDLRQAVELGARCVDDRGNNTDVVVSHVLAGRVAVAVEVVVRDGRAGDALASAAARALHALLATGAGRTEGARGPVAVLGCAAAAVTVANVASAAWWSGKDQRVQLRAGAVSWGGIHSCKQDNNNSSSSSSHHGCKGRDPHLLRLIVEGRGGGGGKEKEEKRNGQEGRREEKMGRH